MFMASLIPQTSRITFGTGVINLPNRHPAVIAAEVAQFDHMSQGRFLFGIGTGSLPSDYELFDVADVEKRNRMLLESMDIIKRIWAQDPPYEFNGEFWKFGIKKAINRELGIGFMPKPLRARRTAGVRRGVEPELVDRTRRRRSADGGRSRARWRPEVVATHWDGYSAGCPEAGARRAATTGGSRPTCWSRLRRRGARARVRADSAYRYTFGYLYEVLKRSGRLANLKPRPDMRDEDDRRSDHRGPRDLRLAGDGGVKLIAFREGRPVRHAPGDRRGLGRPNAAWGRESMRRLVEEVMPAVRRHTAAQAAE